MACHQKWWPTQALIALLLATAAPQAFACPDGYSRNSIGWCMPNIGQGGAKAAPARQFMTDRLAMSSACPSTAAVESVRALNRHAHIQHIKDAASDRVRADDYAIDIGALPRLPGTTAAATDVALLQFIRKNIAQFFDPAIATVTPLDAIHQARWQSPNNADGSLMLFKIKWGSAQPSPLPFPRELPVEQALVVASQVAERHWRFATVRAGLAVPGEHPVSGVREFGLRRSALGMLQFYTRGVDRPTSSSDDAMFPVVNAGQSRTWQAFMDRLSRFIVANGGAAEIATAQVEQFSWQQDVVAKNLFQDSCTSTLRTGTATAATPAEMRALAQIYVATEPSGTMQILAGEALAQLASKPVAADRARLFADITTVADQVRRARSPAELLAALDSEIGRRYGLVSKTAAWNPAELRFVNTGAQLGGTNQAVALQAAANAARQLQTGLQAATAGDMINLMRALTGDASVEPGRLLASIAPPKQRPVLAAAFELAADGAPNEPRLRDLQQLLLENATEALLARSTDVAQTLRAVRRGNEILRAPDFQRLLGGDRTARSLLAGAQVVQWFGAASGNPQLSADIQRVTTHVKAAMQIHESLQLLAIAGSGGGAVMAAMGVLSGSSVLGGVGGANDTAQLMAAIAELTQLVREEFQRVNFKLDRVQDSLDQISTDLRTLGRVQELTLASVDQVRGDLSRLLVTMGQFEIGLKTLVLDVGELPCRPHRMGYNDGVHRDLFFQCLGTYRRMAVTDVTFSSNLSGDLARDFNAQLSLGGFENGETLWQHAGLIAQGSRDWFGLTGAVEFSTPAQARILASGAYLAGGLNQYLLWVNRFGQSYVPAVHAILVQNDELPRLKQRTEQQGRYREALALPGADTRQRLSDFFSAAAAEPATPEYARARDNLREAMRQATVDFVLRELRGSGSRTGGHAPLGEVEVYLCDESDQRVKNFKVKATPMYDAGMPAAGFYFGNTVRGHTSLASVQAGLVDSAGVDGLDICLNVVSIDERRDRGVVFRRDLSATVSIRLGGKEACPPPAVAASGFHFHGMRLGVAPPIETVANDVVIKGIKQCFDGWTAQQKDQWYGGLPERYLDAFGNDPTKLSLLAALASQFARQPALKEDLKIVLADSSARLAFLRAYVALIYPSLWLTQNDLRYWLQAERVPQHADEMIAVFQCAQRVRQSFMTREYQAPDSFDIEARAKELCRSRHFVDVFDRFDFEEPERYLRGYVGGLQRLLQNIDWASGRQLDISSDAWLSKRLAHFIEAGNDPAYYQAVNSDPPR